ncbi:MAG: NgoMIV family type II restriction endonuclease [bacterium]
MKFAQLRKEYHRRICRDLLRIGRDSRKGDYPNNADADSKISVAIAWEIVGQLCDQPVSGTISGQKAGTIFQQITKDFIEKTFELLQHIRPGKWIYSINTERVTTLGSDYIVSPDIVIGRKPEPRKEINKGQKLLGKNHLVAQLTPLLQENSDSPKAILHASISCKWTLRSDRAQNSRTEALNLIRNRKGNLPHIVAVTAEPTTTRIASLALGTGDIDCVYHFALNELRAAISSLGDESQMEMLNMLIDGRRLRDISDLPFDLAV